MTSVEFVILARVNKNSFLSLEVVALLESINAAKTSCTRLLSFIQLRGRVVLAFQRAQEITVA